MGFRLAYFCMDGRCFNVVNTGEVGCDLEE